MAKIELADEFDPAADRRLLEILRSRGAELAEPDYGMAGSQEVRTQVATLADEHITITHETYMGLTIEGADSLLEEIAATFRARR